MTEKEIADKLQIGDTVYQPWDRSKNEWEPLTITKKVTLFRLSNGDYYCPESDYHTSVTTVAELPKDGKIYSGKLVKFTFPKSENPKEIYTLEDAIQLCGIRHPGEAEEALLEVEIGKTKKVYYNCEYTGSDSSFTVKRIS